MDKKSADFAIIVVDVQSDFAAGQKPILARIVALLLFARAEGIDVLHVHSNRLKDKSNWPACYVIKDQAPRLMLGRLG